MIRPATNQPPSASRDTAVIKNMKIAPPKMEVLIGRRPSTKPPMNDRAHHCSPEACRVTASTKQMIKATARHSVITAVSNDLRIPEILLAIDGLAGQTNHALAALKTMNLAR